MKRIFFLLIIVMNCFLLFGHEHEEIKGRLQGIVQDAATGKPVSNATVYVSDAKVGTSTNADGFYSFSNLGTGRHLIEVSHVGYSAMALQVIVGEVTEQNFSLSEAIVENNAVIVTGVSKATQLKKMPFQVSVIRKEDLLQTTSSNIIESISKKPGVSMLSTGPAISKPFIRGLGYNRVLTVNDGVRQEGQQWGDEHGIEIDDNSVQKIEILKGPASLIYGSDAMAGVINIITNVPVSDNTLQATVGSEYQTNSRLRNVYANIAANKNGFNWNAYGSIKEASDYKNKYDGNVFNSKYKERNFGGYAGLNGGWGYSHLIFSNFDLNAGLIEGDRDNEGRFIKSLPGGQEVSATSADFRRVTPLIPYQHIRHMKLASDNNFRIGSENLSVNVGVQQNKREEFGNTDDISERALFFDLKTLTYTTKLNLHERNGWKPSIGINGMSQKNTNRGVEQLIPDYTLNDVGGFIFTEKDFGKLTISGGARLDNRSIQAAALLDDGNQKGVPFKKDFSNFSGSAGLAYAASNTINLKFNIARAFRAPSIPELGSKGSHEGTIRYEYGDASLKSELSTQVDAGFELNNKHFNFNLAGYYNNFSNFIFYRKLESANGGDSTVDVTGNAITAFQFDQRKAYLAGLEATLDVHPHPIHWLHFQNTFSLVSGRFQQAIEGTKNLPYIPAPRLITELRADLKSPSRSFLNAYVKLELDNTFAQNNAFTAFDTETKTPGYSLLNAGMGTDLINKKGNKILTLNFGALNLTDKAYQNHLSRLKYAPENASNGRLGVFNSGRNFSFKILIPMKVHLGEGK